MRAAILLMLCLLLVPAAVVFADDCTLVRDGEARGVILVPKDASPSMRWAAEELQAVILEMSGAKLPINPGTDAIVQSKARVIIGPLADLDEKLAARLGDEGYWILAGDHAVAISGSPKRGAMYGVFTLLERLGVRWWTPTETFIPKRRTVTVPAMDLREAPRLEYRDLMYRELQASAGPPAQEWMAHNKVNGMIWHDAPEKLGGRYPFGGKMLAHTLMDLLKSNRIEITPEMMSMDAKGNRAKPGSRGHQLCFTSKAAIEAMTRAVVAEYRKDPAIRFVMVGQEDGYNYCRCPDCEAIAKREESQAGPVIHFANAVAEAAEKEVPGAAVATNAYVWSRTPPKTLRPRKNVYIALASYECDFGHPMATSVAQAGEWGSVAFRKDLEGWNRIAPKIYVWDYSTNFLQYLMPYPNLDVLAPNMKYYADHGVVGVMSQGAWGAFGAEFFQLRAWVLARAMWNPEADNHVLITRFLNGYYGPAAPAVQSYIDVIERTMRDHPDYVLGIYKHLNSSFIAPAIIADAEAALREADKAAADSGDEAIQRRVRHAHMPVWYVLLKMGPGSAMWRAVGAKVGALDAAAVAASFSQVVKDYRMNEVCEGGPGKAFFEWVADYGPRCAEGRVPAPPELAEADWTRTRLIQGCQMDRGASWYVRAEGASDGWAIRPANGRQTLHYLSDTNDFTPGRTYRAFVRARGEDVAEGATGEVWTCRVGKGAASVTAEQLRDGQWHTFEIGTVKPEGIGTPIESQLLWKNRGSLKTVAIDCIWLAEAASP